MNNKLGRKCSWKIRINNQPFLWWWELFRNIYRKRKTRYKIYFGSESIVYDTILFALLLSALLEYFQAVTKTLIPYCATLKLRKWTFIGLSQEFLGLDITDSGNSPASVNHKASIKIARPRRFYDMHMLIGMFGFYAPWIPFYEVRILTLCNLLRQEPGENPTSGSIISDRQHVDTIRWWSGEGAPLRHPVWNGVGETGLLSAILAQKYFSSMGIGLILLLDVEIEDPKHAEYRDNEG